MKKKKTNEDRNFLIMKIKNNIRKFRGGGIFIYANIVAEGAGGASMLIIFQYNIFFKIGILIHSF